MITGRARSGSHGPACSGDYSGSQLQPMQFGSQLQTPYFRPYTDQSPRPSERQVQAPASCPWPASGFAALACASNCSEGGEDAGSGSLAGMGNGQSSCDPSGGRPSASSDSSPLCLSSAAAASARGLRRALLAAAVWAPRAGRPAGMVYQSSRDRPAGKEDEATHQM